MERVVDPVLLQYLWEYYAGLYDFKKTGIESEPKDWFINKAEQKFCLCLIGEDGKPLSDRRELSKVSY